jgi:uncharacterized repeat protein (TIGR03803 family)
MKAKGFTRFMQLVFPIALCAIPAAYANTEGDEPNGKFETIALFSGTGAPSLPEAGLVQGVDGNFYGTSYYGGANNFGTVYSVTANGVVTVLHSFAGGSDGEGPAAALIMGSDGALYGTTVWGGSGPCTNSQGNGCGTVFRITPDGTESIVYSFQSGGDGYAPTTGVIQVANGDLYGATNGGGIYNSGTIFHITAAGVESIIHTYNYGVDGGAPSGLVQGLDGNIYGLDGYFFGAVFRLTLTGDFTILYSFGANPNDAAFPNGMLTMDSNGNLYGTASSGGTSGFGAIFEVTPGGMERIVYSFTNGQDGGTPNGTVYIGSDGLLYGTTQYGGAHGHGTVYQINENGSERTLHSFANCSYTSVGGTGFALIADNGDALYGATTGNCGAIDGSGGVFRLKANQ